MSSRMTLRVLTLSTLFPDASRPNFGVFVERQTMELARRSGIEATIVAPLGIGPWPLSRKGHYATLSDLPMQETWKGLEVHRPRFTVIPKIGGRWHVDSMTRAITPLVRKLHAEKPFDVIDASFFFPDGPVAARLSKMLGIPFSIKARGADIHYWGTAPATAKQVLDAGRKASGLLAVSAAMKESMIALGMDGEKIRVHYTGVDLDRFQPMDKSIVRQELGIKDIDAKLILCVGALIPRKGQDLLIQSLRKLPGYGLMLAGAGPAKDSLQKLATCLGVDNRVTFLGAVPHTDLPKLFNAADVMALPSASEGLANAWVESLASGTPIVISDVGGARELLNDPAAGRIIERNSGDIAHAIRELLDHPIDRDAVRAAALRFTWATNGDALVEHLREIANASTLKRQ
jgi:teichuronic acid biosynthesis glycosyltransferase TuaC